MFQDTFTTSMNCLKPTLRSVTRQCVFVRTVTRCLDNLDIVDFHADRASLTTAINILSEYEEFYHCSNDLCLRYVLSWFYRCISRSRALSTTACAL